MNNTFHATGQPTAGRYMTELQNGMGVNPSLHIMQFDEFLQGYPEFGSSGGITGFCCIFLIRNGVLQLLVGNRLYRPAENTLLHCAPGQFLKIVQAERVRAEVIIFQKANLRLAKFGTVMMESFRIFSPAVESEEIIMQTDEYDTIEILTNRIKRELAESEFEKNLEFIQNVFISLLFLIERIKRNRIAENLALTGDAALMQSFVKLLELHYANERTVEYYAEALHVTTRKLNNAVSACCGLPVKKIIEQRVIKGITSRLLNTDETLKEIGFAFGFKDPTNFNKYFKKHMHQTPAAFKLHKERRISTIERQNLTI